MAPPASPPTTVSFPGSCQPCLGDERVAVAGGRESKRVARRLTPGPR